MTVDCCSGADEWSMSFPDATERQRCLLFPRHHEEVGVALGGGVRKRVGVALWKGVCREDGCGLEGWVCGRGGGGLEGKGL